MREQSAHTPWPAEAFKSSAALGRPFSVSASHSPRVGAIFFLGTFSQVRVLPDTGPRVRHSFEIQKAKEKRPRDGNRSTADCYSSFMHAHSSMGTGSPAKALTASSVPHSSQIMMSKARLRAFV